MADGPRLTALGKIFIFLFVILCVGGAYYTFNNNKLSKPKSSPSAGGMFDSLTGSGEQVEVGIAYGTEKQRWLEWAVQEFGKTRDGKRIKINLIPMGSLEGAHALLNGDQRIQVWCPASALYKDIFVEEWQVKYGQNPILKEEPIALSPMVFVMWDERYQAFVQKYKTLSFVTVGQALQEKGGWDAIAQKPDWGLFKFGHTHPNESNSGLMTIVLAAYSYQKKTKDLQVKDVVDVGFQTWMQGLERAVSGLSNSTGNMMKEMVLKGPSSYDVMFVYESVAIDYLKNAEGRWGQLRIVYPEYNSWNENPYYIIDASWSSKEQRKAAETFLAFLLTEPIQKESLTHGFRPANPNVPVKFPESPFVKYADYGIKVDLAKICDPPRAEVVNNLLQSWQRSQANR
ncbi:MAG TPA: extracellular solute-binding protein [Candidatus Acidoferrum sp.]|jgi:ABC-type Fe3+ transport system substrate-binding protein